ncbi:MAG: histidine phosphatase family protein [Leptothrix sp. (in: b-proteobacteria)]
MPDQQATRVLAIRHGETAWNRESRIQGHIDIALNDAGLAQAAALAEALADEPLAAIYSSDLQRAHQTASAVAARQGLPVRVDIALRERHFGDFEGRSYAVIDVEQPELARRWRQRDPDFGPPGGEVLQAFYERCVSTLDRLAAAHRGEAIAIVCHGGVLDCLYRAATRVSLQAPRTWAVANASVNRLLYSDGGSTLVGWGDIQHLEATGHAPLDSRFAHHERVLAAGVLDEASDGGRG